MQQELLSVLSSHGARRDLHLSQKTESWSCGGREVVVSFFVGGLQGQTVSESKMRQSEDHKGSYGCGSAAPDAHSNTSSTSSFELHKCGGNGAGKTSSSQHRGGKHLGGRAKATPSKWDDAQKWLAGLSGGGGGDRGYSKSSKPRNSNADDRRLLHSASQRARDSCSSADGALAAEEGETKRIDCSEAFWTISRPDVDCPLAVRSVCVRDMGTEMTPVASQEPSRTATPLRATSPALRSPISSRPSTPSRNRPAPPQVADDHPAGAGGTEGRQFEAVPSSKINGPCRSPVAEDLRNSLDSGAAAARHQPRNANSLESRAMAWDEAERAKYMARYKREEVKIQAWENHEKRKAEMEMKRTEVKAERLRARAQERLTNKMAAARRIAEEKRTNAEAKLNERAARTAERADYIRRTGHLPSSFFSFRLPSLCG